ncbi:APC family permease [Streptomyces sp. CA-135486]|uniref:APC family permease n=1 Tax=Streptomyces sp. CA-135486 TaxID=3240049 RepID=UPI003D94C088
MAVEQLSTPSTDSPPRRGIGVSHIVFFVVAASAPLTVAAGGSPQAFAVTGSVGYPLAFLVLTVVLVVFSAGYAAMSRHITNAGAFYSYVAQGLGRSLGVGTSFVALVSYNAMQIGIYGLFGYTAADLAETRLGLDLPWWVYVLACIAAVGVLGYRRIDLNAKVLAVLLVIETVTVAVFDAGQFLDPGPQGISATPLSYDALATGAVGAAFCFAMAGFMGFESGAIYGEECRDPRRTIPRATYLAVVLMGVFYALSAWALAIGAGPGLVVGAAQEQGPGLFFALGEQRLGSAFGDIANVFFLTSLLAAILSFHNAVARYSFALGREHVLPGALGAVHPRHRSPHVSSLAQTGLAALTVIVFAAAGLDPLATLFTWLTNLGALGVIFLLTVVSAAVIGFFARDGRGERLWSRAVAPVLGGTALAAVFITALINFDVLLGAAKDSSLTWILPGVLLAAGIAGVAFGLFLKFRRPLVHKGIGHGADEGTQLSDSHRG